MDKNKNISFKDVKQHHEQLIKSYNIPDWVSKQECPKCNKQLGFLSLRAIGLKLNAQHIGNAFVEVCCQHCCFGYDLHLKNACKNIGEFIDLLKSNKTNLKLEPDYLISNSENNLVKDIVKDISKGE